LSFSVFKKTQNPKAPQSETFFYSTLNNQIVKSCIGYKSKKYNYLIIINLKKNELKNYTRFFNPKNFRPSVGKDKITKSYESENKNSVGGR
jgi:hypothetical protein